MKFGAQWKQRVAELPDSLREAAVSYKAWKKRVKADPSFWTYRLWGIGG